MSQKIYYNPSTAQRQYFSFAPDVIKYAVKDSNASIWLKLLKSCKYFYLKYKVLIFKNVTLNDFAQIKADEKYMIKRWKNFDEIPCELFLAGKLNIAAPLAFLKPKIFKCELQELNIVGNEITFDEFEFLVNAETLESFLFHNTVVKYSNKSVVQLEDVFAALPNVTSFTYRHTISNFDEAINTQTFYRMANTCRNRKLLSIDIQGISNDASPSDIVLFIENYAANHCKIILNLKSNYVQRIIFKSMINQMRQKWKPQFGMPFLDIKFTSSQPPYF